MDELTDSSGDWQKQPSDYKPPADTKIEPAPPPVDLGDTTVQGAPPAPPKIESPPEAKVEFKGLAVRTGGDKVFVLKEGKKHWATNPEALEKAGFTLKNVVEIDRLTLGLIPESEPLK